MASQNRGNTVIIDAMKIAPLKVAVIVSKVVVVAVIVTGYFIF
jgi:hypothetical protein